MRVVLAAIFMAVNFPQPVLSETVVAARTIRSHTVLTAADFRLQSGDTPGAVRRIADIIGLEARVVLYEGRPVAISDVAAAAIIERNQTVKLIFASGPIVILAEARSLGRAGIGDHLKVMNLASRKTITGVVNKDGNVVVGVSPFAGSGSD